MKTWQGILLGTFLGLAAAAVLVLVISPPRGEAIVLLPTSSPAPIVVYVSGAVNTPGVVSLPRQSRVLDAVQAAGGFSEDADQEAVNLAAKVSDGERVIVLTRSALATKASVASTAAVMGSKAGGILLTPTVAYPINLNTATQQELEALPTIGPTKATQILEYRQKNGLFEKIEDIQNVPGIGPSTFEKIKAFITLGN